MNVVTPSQYIMDNESVAELEHRKLTYILPNSGKSLQFFIEIVN